MSAHGIPSVLSVLCGRSRQPVREQVPGTLLQAVSGDEGPAGETRDHAVAVDVQGGLHRMRYPFHWRLNRLVANPPAPSPAADADAHESYFNQAILTSPSRRAAYSRSGAAMPRSCIPVPSAVCAAAASHSLAATSGRSRGADRPPNGSAGQLSSQPSHAPPTPSTSPPQPPPPRPP